MDPPLVGNDEAYARLTGFLLAVVGWLYVFGGRSGGRQFVAATVVDRILFVPVPLLLLAHAGIEHNTLISFAILDPVLAIGAWVLLNRESKL